MSKLKVSTISDPDNDNTALSIDTSGNVTVSQGFVPATQLSHRNLIINGAMQVHQRGGTINSAAGNKYVVDRFALGVYGSGTGAMSGQQLASTNAPDGLRDYFRATVTTTDNPSGTEAYLIYHPLEGLALRPTGFGTVNAKTLTMSFYVRSSITGDYSFAIQDSAAGYSFIKGYTINSANTWEKKTITISPATSIGSWALDVVTRGAILSWGLGGLASGSREGAEDTWFNAGGYTLSRVSSSVNWINNSGATFDITGVQLEIGSVATPFEHRSYGEELARCQRYFQLMPSGSLGRWTTSTVCEIFNSFPVKMRTTPTALINPNDNTCYIFIVGVAANLSTISLLGSGYLSASGGAIVVTVSSTSYTPSGGNFASYQTHPDSDVIFLDSEL